MLFLRAVAGFRIDIRTNEEAPVRYVFSFDALFNSRMEIERIA